MARTAGMLPILASHATDSRVVGMIIIGINVGSLGLNFVLLSRLIRQARRNLCHTLTFLVCTNDIVLCVEVLVKYSVCLVFWDGLLPEGRSFCNVFGTLTLVLTCASSMLIGLLATERYLRVCKERGLRLFPVLLALAAAFVALVVLGIGTATNDGYLADPEGILCRPGSGGWPLALDAAVRVVLVSSLLTVIPCYLGIYFRCRRHSDTPNLVVAKTLLPIVLYCCNLVPFLVYVILVAASGEEGVPKIFFVLALLSAATIPNSNSLLVMFFHDEFREAMCVLFRRPYDVLRSVIWARHG